MDKDPAHADARETAAERGAVLFDAILHPHCSLSRRGFFFLMAAVVVVSLSVGGFFFLRGAWPVFGFFGLDVLILYLAFRYNYRRAAIYETVRLTDSALTVEKGGSPAGRRVWTFQPHWLRVSMDDPPRHESQVTLTSHGKSLVVGAFLSPEERLDFAQALMAALDRLRRPFGEAGVRA